MIKEIKYFIQRKIYGYDERETRIGYIFLIHIKNFLNNLIKRNKQIDKKYKIKEQIEKIEFLINSTNKIKNLSNDEIVYYIKIYNEFTKWFNLNMEMFWE